MKNDDYSDIDMSEPDFLFVQQNIVWIEFFPNFHFPFVNVFTKPLLVKKTLTGQVKFYSVSNASAL